MARHERASKTRPAQRSARPVLVTALTLTLLLGGVGLATRALLTEVARAEKLSSRLADRTVPGLVDFLDLADAVQDAHRAFVAGVAPGATERDALLQEASLGVEEVRLARTQFNRGGYAEDSEELWERFDRDWAEGISAATKLIAELGKPPSDPALIAAQDASSKSRAAIDADLAELMAVYGDEAERAAADLPASPERLRQMIVAFASGISVLLIVAAGTAARRERRRLLDDLDREDQSKRTALEARLHRAVELVDQETLVLEAAEHALKEVFSGENVEFLMSDESMAHLAAQSASGVCAPGGPRSCPASRSGQLLFSCGTNKLDTCPYLTGGSALCVPITAAGAVLGVAQVTSDESWRPEPAQEESLQMVSRKAGERLALLRALARSEHQAATDPLTGLLNRRSFDEHLGSVETPYAVAFFDLDHFKELNDTYGHRAGDQALRCFASVLRETLRPTDLGCRWGGEEFVVVLPECDTVGASAVAERLRTKLAEVVARGSVPTFTVSVGLASSSQASGFGEAIHLADEAMLEAKAAGRDRIVTFGTIVAVD